MPLEYSWQWHTTKNQKNYDSDICSVLKNQFEFTQIIHCAEKCAMPRCLSLHINLHDLLRQNHGSLISLQLFLAHCYIVQVLNEVVLHKKFPFSLYALTDICFWIQRSAKGLCNQRQKGCNLLKFSKCKFFDKKFKVHVVSVY